MASNEVCTGCDSHRIQAIRAVIAGRAACCPDCSTLTVTERNAIRQAVANRLREALVDKSHQSVPSDLPSAAGVKAEPSRATIGNAMIDAALAVLNHDYGARVLFSRSTVQRALLAANVVYDGEPADAEIEHEPPSAAGVSVTLAALTEERAVRAASIAYLEANVKSVFEGMKNALAAAFTAAREVQP